ncbi:MAG: hypothetical protein K2V38_05365 [Gemmataceae bacterium]|nr:hypothetical protein [Gemmataceae bacterium]
MARTRRDEPEDEWDEGDDYDAERDYDPDDTDTYPEGLYADNEPALIPCPHCRAEIDEESQQCPRCRVFLSREDAPARATPTWVVLLILALLATMVLTLGR